MPSDRLIDRVCVHALCKFMCVSQKATQDNLQTLLDLLFSRASEAIKTIIVISLGDLTRRFPNELQ
ncbi:MAG: hypothetical protein ACK521_00075 [bacterium]